MHKSCALGIVYVQRGHHFLIWYGLQLARLPTLLCNHCGLKRQLFPTKQILFKLPLKKKKTHVMIPSVAHILKLE